MYWNNILFGEGTRYSLHSVIVINRLRFAAVERSSTFKLLTMYFKSHAVLHVAKQKGVYFRLDRGNYVL